MSAPDPSIPSTIPTSHDPRSRRPLKKARTANTSDPTTAQAAALTTLFARPDQPIRTTPAAPRGPAPPPEIVTNVQGSSAGAGSGEFHVYKAARRREHARARRMDAELVAEREQGEFEARRREMETQDGEKTRRNREKRDKAKARKAKAKAAGKGGGDEKATAGGEDGKAKANGDRAGVKKVMRRDVSDSDDAMDASSTTAAMRPAVAVKTDVPGIVIHDED